MTPLAVGENEETAADDAPEAWHGARATLVGGDGSRTEEIVLLLQDGLRLFQNGDLTAPLPDFPPGVTDHELDKEDQGQKAFNYRTEPVGVFDPGGRADILGIADPATPVFRVPVGKPGRLHLVGACDKPRNHSFTVHGVAWPEWRFLADNQQQPTSSESAVTSGTGRTFDFSPRYPGDHAYRSGVLAWDVQQGLWGIIRVGAAGTERRHPLGLALLAGIGLGLGLLAAWRRRGD